MQTETCEINPWFFFFLTTGLWKTAQAGEYPTINYRRYLYCSKWQSCWSLPHSSTGFCCREVNVFDFSTAFRFYGGVWLNYIGQLEGVNYCPIVQDFKPVKSHCSRFNLHFQSSVSWLELWLWMYLMWVSIFYMLEQESFIDLNVKLRCGVNLSDSWESLSASYKTVDGKAASLFLDSAQIFCLLIGNCRNLNKLT